MTSVECVKPRLKPRLRSVGRGSSIKTMVQAPGSASGVTPGSASSVTSRSASSVTPGNASSVTPRSASSVTPRSALGVTPGSAEPSNDCNVAGASLRKPSTSSLNNKMVSNSNGYSQHDALGAKSKSNISQGKPDETSTTTFSITEFDIRGDQEKILQLQAELEITKRLLTLKTNQSIREAEAREQELQHHLHQQQVHNLIDREEESSLTNGEVMNNKEVLNKKIDKLMEMMSSNSNNASSPVSEFHVELNKKIDKLMEMMSSNSINASSPVSSLDNDSASLTQHHHLGTQDQLNNSNISQSSFSYSSDAMMVRPRQASGHLNGIQMQRFLETPFSHHPDHPETPYQQFSSNTQASVPQPSVNLPRPLQHGVPLPQHLQQGVPLPQHENFPPNYRYQPSFPQNGFINHDLNYSTGPSIQPLNPPAFQENQFRREFSQETSRLYQEKSRELSDPFHSSDDNTDNDEKQMRKEQELIMAQIREENRRKKEEESLSLKLIEEIQFNNQNSGHNKDDIYTESFPSVIHHLSSQQTTSQSKTLQTKSEEFFHPLASPDEWIKVGKPVKQRLSSQEKKASVKVVEDLEKQRQHNTAVEEWRKAMLEKEEEEKMRLVKKSEEASKVQFIKEADMINRLNLGQVNNRAQCLAAAPLAAVVPHPRVIGGTSQRSKKKEVETKRAKVNPETAKFETERRKAAEELKQRLDAQV